MQQIIDLMEKFNKEHVHVVEKNIQVIIIQNFVV